jgi:ABC-type amino acid transport substrate-binding protein
MRRRAIRSALAACVALLGLAAPAALADTIRLRADAYCPTNCAPDAARPGYAVEIAREVFEAAGHEVEYDLLAWPRAIADAQAGLYDGVIGAAAEEVPGFNSTAGTISTTGSRSCRRWRWRPWTCSSRSRRPTPDPGNGARCSTAASPSCA